VNEKTNSPCWAAATKERKKERSDNADVNLIKLTQDRVYWRD